MRRLFDYNPLTGIVTRKISTSARGRSGNTVGWYTAGYRYVQIDGTEYRLHRIIWLWMTGSWPKHEIDHDNRVRDDNRWENLFDRTPQQNGRNKTMSTNNTSGVVGVYWSNKETKWRAQIKIDGKMYSLGCYIEFDDAVIARRKAEKKYGFHPNHCRSAEAA